MVTTQRPAFKRIVKVVAAVTLVAFFWQDVVMAQGGAPAWKPSASSPASAKTGTNQAIEVPPNLGIRRSAHETGGDELIINIQDAHASLDAQKATAEICSNLVSQYNLDLIGIEGSSGRIDTSLVSSFPVQKVRQMVAESMLRDTRIGGAEFFKIVSNNDVEIVGVEDPELYKGNVRVYQRLISDEVRIRRALTGLKEILRKLEKSIFSEKVRE